MKTNVMKAFKFIQKQWLLLWIVIVSFAMIAMTANAFYESTANSMNRVVVASSTQGMMFSSNYLEKGGEMSYQAKYCIEFQENDKATSTYDAEIYLWNYNLTNISRWYSEAINYNLKIKFTNTRGEALGAGDIKALTVKLYDSDNNELSELNSSKRDDTIVNQSIPSNSSQSSEKQYTLKFSGNWDLDKDTEICVQMIAELDRGNDANKYKDLKDLGQIIGLKRSSNSESKGWQVYLKEQRNKETVSKCDGYNFVVTGSGQADITITWDTRYLDFNRYFYNKDSFLYNYSEVNYTPAANSSDDTWATMVIQANTASNTTNHRNRYDIQLYKTGTTQPSDWSFFAGKDATPTQQSAAWVRVTVGS